MAEQQFQGYYKTLGVDPNTPQNDIKQIFRKLSRQYHPDANPDDPEAEEKFKEVIEAYEILKNDEKREAYDAFIKHHKRNKNTFPDMYSFREAFKDWLEKYPERKNGRANTNNGQNPQGRHKDDNPPSTKKNHTYSATEQEEENDVDVTSTEFRKFFTYNRFNLHFEAAEKAIKEFYTEYQQKQKSSKDIFTHLNNDINYTDDIVNLWKNVEINLDEEISKKRQFFEQEAIDFRKKELNKKQTEAMQAFTKAKQALEQYQQQEKTNDLITTTLEAVDRFTAKVQAECAEWQKDIIHDAQNTSDQLINTAILNRIAGRQLSAYRSIAEFMDKTQKQLNALAPASASTAESFVNYRTQNLEAITRAERLQEGYQREQETLTALQAKETAVAQQLEEVVNQTEAAVATYQQALAKAIRENPDDTPANRLERQFQNAQAISTLWQDAATKAEDLYTQDLSQNFTASQRSIWANFVQSAQIDQKTLAQQLQDQRNLDAAAQVAATAQTAKAAAPVNAVTAPAPTPSAPLQTSGPAVNLNTLHALFNYTPKGPTKAYDALCIKSTQCNPGNPSGTSNPTHPADLCKAWLAYYATLIPGSGQEFSDYVNQLKQQQIHVSEIDAALKKRGHKPTGWDPSAIIQLNEEQAREFLITGNLSDQAMQSLLTSLQSQVVTPPTRLLDPPETKDPGPYVSPTILPISPNIPPPTNTAAPTTPSATGANKIPTNGNQRPKPGTRADLQEKAKTHTRQVDTGGMDGTYMRAKPGGTMPAAVSTMPAKAKPSLSTQSAETSPKWEPWLNIAGDALKVGGSFLITIPHLLDSIISGGGGLGGAFQNACEAATELTEKFCELVAKTLTVAMLQPQRT